MTKKTKLAEKLPRSITLPSRVRVLIELGGGAPSSERRSERRTSEAEMMRAAAALLEGRLLRAEDRSPIHFASLSLEDAHVLVGVLTRSELIQEPEAMMPCHNCGAKLAAKPSQQLEIGPFVDGELDDPELDARFDFSVAHRIPSVSTAHGIARTVRLSPRAVDEAALLFAARPRGDAKLILGAALVSALGIASLGKERRGAAIARALRRATPEAWAALAELWERAHYSARMFGLVACASCTARNDLPVPFVRVFDAIAPPEPFEHEACPPPGFPSDEAFDAMVEAARRRVFEKRGVRAIQVVVDSGVAACDDGGEPLLGSYVPSELSLSGEETGKPLITIYLRTFQSEFRLDKSFDVKAEIEETLDHEVEHHLNYLRGFDPMDEDERLVIAKDRERVIGRKELARREARSAIEQIPGFIVRSGPILLVLALAAYLQLCRGQ